jgi:hypothetical protein
MGRREDLGYPQPPLRPAVPAVPRTGTSTGTNGTGTRTRGSGTRTVQLWAAVHVVHSLRGTMVQTMHVLVSC